MFRYYNKNNFGRDISILILDLMDLNVLKSLNKLYLLKNIQIRDLNSFWCPNTLC